jgi:hypothetical protein
MHASDRKSHPGYPAGPSTHHDDPHEAPVQTETGEQGPVVVDPDDAVPEDQVRAEEARATRVVGHEAVDDVRKAGRSGKGA